MTTILTCFCGLVRRTQSHVDSEDSVLEINEILFYWQFVWTVKGATCDFPTCYVSNVSLYKSKCERIFYIPKLTLILC